ncbi:MAG: hypothetical protein AB7E55_16990, partial [Pigmentiphaga sp.]
LGESSRTAPAGAGVTQAGWVQAITTSFLSTGSGRSSKGLFAADITPATGPLPWSRPQQAAFLITLWDSIRLSLENGRHAWVEQLMYPNGQQPLEIEPPTIAFSGTRTMLNQEQGVRGVLAVANEIFFSLAQIQPDLFEFDTQIMAGAATRAEDVSVALREIENSKIFRVIAEFGAMIAGFDWRSADAPGLDDDIRLRKRAFRGSSGYVALREQLFLHLSGGAKPIAEIASESLKRLS